MKLAFIYNDEAWFWIWNSETEYWEAWYEGGDVIAERVTKFDRQATASVTDIMGGMAYAAANGQPSFTTV